MDQVGELFSKKRFKVTFFIEEVFLAIASIFCTLFLAVILRGWSDSFNITATTIITSRFGEIVAFALCLITVIYTIGITILYFVNLKLSKNEPLDYHGYSRMNTIVIVGLIFYWVIFSIIFLRP